jgi:ribosomal protein L20
VRGFISAVLRSNKIRDILNEAKGELGNEKYWYRNAQAL